MVKALNIIRIWEEVGITQHWGGVGATLRLASLCGIREGMKVLDVGCGTGFTACLLTKRFGARVTALDFAPGLLRAARERARREGVEGRIRFVRGDVERLPFKDGQFDAVICESVLLFCDEAKAASEILRVLKPGGMYGGNEGTFIRRPPRDLEMFFEHSLGSDISFHTASGWRRIFSAAGFREVHSEVHRVSAWDDFSSHMRIDGPIAFLKGMRIMFSPVFRKNFLKLDTIVKFSGIFKYAGYGLFHCRK